MDRVGVRPGRPLGVATWLGVAVSLLLAGLAGWRLVQHASWVTAPRHVAWLDGRGVAIAGDVRCGDEMGFGVLVQGKHAWLSCTAGDREALGIVDIAARTGRLLLFDDPGSLRGVLPIGDGLAFVWKSRSKGREGLVIALVGPEGRTRVPAPLNAASLEGMGVVDDAVELVVRRSDESLDALPSTIWRVPLAGDPIERRFALACPRDVERDLVHPCDVVAAYVDPGDGGWRFVTTSYREQIFAMREDGTRQAIEALPFGFDPSRDGRAIDRIATGMLHIGFEGFVARLAPDGRIEHVEPSAHASYLVARDGALERARSWVDGSNRVHPADERDIVLTPLLADRSPAPRETSWDAFEYVAVGERGRDATIVARTRDCSRLANGVPIPDGHGGWLVLDREGCYVALDGALRRTDGWSVLDHLRMRGSRFMRRDEPTHAMKLAFILFGLPLLALATRASRRARTRAWALPTVVWTHTLFSAWCLHTLWPLLR